MFQPEEFEPLWSIDIHKKRILYSPNEVILIAQFRRFLLPNLKSLYICHAECDFFAVKTLVIFTFVEIKEWLSVLIWLRRELEA